jgi:formylglycine-generating enzyme required for sulfatase activity
MVRMLLIVHLNAGEMPKHRVELYKEAVEKLLFPDFGTDVKAQAHLRKLLHADQKTQRNMMQHIAVALHTRGRTQGRTVEKTALEQLLAASPFAAHTEQLLALSSLRGGLLEERNGRYQFMHLALQEYLVARYLGETVRSEGGVKAIAAYLQQNALGESWWREVTLLTVGYLYDIDPAYAAELVRQLAVCGDGRGAAAAPYFAAELAAAGCLEWLADDPTLRQELSDRLAALVNDKSLMLRATPAARASAGDALARLGDPRPGVTVRWDTGLPDIGWVKIPEFGPQGQREFLFHDGIRNVPHSGLPTFWIAKYPITYAQFQVFVNAPDGYCNEQWRKGLVDYFGEDGTRWPQRLPRANRPRENVTWPEAVAFCRWLTEQARAHPDLLPDPEAQALLAVGGEVRLPTEQEWVKATRGWDDRLYPWGGQAYQIGYANVDETEKKTGPNYLRQTSAVGMYRHGASPFGVEELSGNVWEYCMNKYKSPNDLSMDGGGWRAIRGGSWYSNVEGSSVVARVVDVVQGGLSVSRGLRVVCAASP